MNYYSIAICQNLQGSNWCFGDSCGLNFSSGTPLPFISSLKSQGACASISDSLGNLLFYTNGIKVWDRNHNQMPNGFGLYAVYEFPNYGSNVSEGTLIIPYPNHPDSFLIFTSSNLLDTGIHYSIVNMLMNSSNGDVEVKNVHLYHQKIYQALTAVRHANGRDWWVISHKLNGDSFYWFLIDPSGVTGPFVQNIGPNISNGGFDLEGETDVSLDGSKFLMVCQRSVDVYDIDRCKGQLKNHLPILYFNMSYGALGASFSPNGKLFYSTAKGDTLFQYNLDDAPDSIYLKRKLIFDNIYYSPTGSTGHPLNILKLGRDNKLYFTLQYEVLPSNVFDSINTKLSVINFPDSIGSACGLSLNSVDLGGRRTLVDLPNMPNYNLGPIDGSACDTLGLNNHDGISEIQTEKYYVYPNPVVDGEACFHLPANNEKQITVTITDLAGKICFVKIRNTSEPCIEIPLWVNSGMYLYTILGNMSNRIMMKGKLLVQN